MNDLMNELNANGLWRVRVIDGLLLPAEGIHHHRATVMWRGVAYVVWSYKFPGHPRKWGAK